MSNASLLRTQELGLDALRARAAENVRARSRPIAATPLEIKGKRLHRQNRLLAATEDSDLALARAFLADNRSLLRLDDPDKELRLVRRQKDALGCRHLRFAQVYKGLDVWPAELVVHLSASGDVELVNGYYVATPRNAVVEPRVTAEHATSVANTLVPGGKTVAGPTLLLHVGWTTTPRLAWRLEIKRSFWSRTQVFIDALDGRVVCSNELVASENTAGSGIDLLGRTRPLNVWRDPGFFRMIDTSKAMYDPQSQNGAIFVLDRLGGTDLYYYVDSTVATSWSNPDAVSAAYSLSEVYDYFLERHGRDSIDGNGGSLFGVVRDGGTQNASWNGQVMSFGTSLPYAAALDVVAHEMTHGVVQHTANLEYANQPGALNEAFADILGESAEARTKGAPDWVLGADTGVIVRNMADPGSLRTPSGHRYPSRMSEFYGPGHPAVVNDSGGVHVNSSIINHCYYLLAEGMEGAIGLRDAERIFYRALAVHLGKNSQFIDARLACIAAAEELFGAGSTQADRTAEAFDLVEIGDAPGGSGGPSEFPEVTTDDSILFLYELDGTLHLGRREAAQDDPDTGVDLTPDHRYQQSQISVSGSGAFAVAILENNDGALIDTASGEVFELGFPGEIQSMAVSPDGNRFAFVVRDEFGQPTNEISLIDVSTDPPTAESITLQSTVIDGGGVNSLLFADAMDFSADNRLLIYDALSRVQEQGGSTFDSWSIYALDLTTGVTYTLIPPLRDVSVGFPTFANTSDNFLTFEAFDFDTNISTIYAGNLSTGTLSAVQSFSVGANFAVPVYTGDDSGILYSAPDDAQTTQSSLVIQNVGARLTPLGTPLLFLADASYGTIYRRGLFEVPNSEPDAVINTPIADTTILEGGTVFLSATGQDPNGHYPLTYRWSANGQFLSAAEDPGPVPFNRPGTYQVTVTAIDSRGLADSTPHVRTVTVLQERLPDPQATLTPPLPPPSGGGCALNEHAKPDPALLLVFVWLVLRLRARFRRSSPTSRTPSPSASS